MLGEPVKHYLELQSVLSKASIIGIVELLFVDSYLSVISSWMSYPPMINSRLPLPNVIMLIMKVICIPPTIVTVSPAMKKISQTQTAVLNLLN